MGEPAKLSWPVRFGGLLEAVNGNDIDPSGRTDLLKLLDEAKREGKLAELEDWQQAITVNEWPDQLECDCTALSVTDERGELLASVPLHQLASVGSVHEPPENILALKVGDVQEGAPDLFDLLVLYTPSEAVAQQVCQHFVLCFQFLYREAISAMEQVQLEHEEEEVEEGSHQHRGTAMTGAMEHLAKKFVPASSASASLCSSSLSCSQPRLASSGSPLVDEPGGTMLLSAMGATGAMSTSTSSNSTRQAVELINEYLTMLSACLSHDELNKFAILMRRWRAREMPILEFAQKLLELYGPERRHLLARMRSLLRGDPADLEALCDFLRANGVVENAAASLPSPLHTAEMSLGSLETTHTASCPPSASSSHLLSASMAVPSAAAHHHQHSRSSS